MKKTKTIIISISLLSSILFLGILFRELPLIINKTSMVLQNLREEDNKVEDYRAYVLAVFPPSVNNLSSCSFTTGEVGDIFVKNCHCSWSDYKCTLTDYDNCSGYMEFGSPQGDACWCYGYGRVCSIYAGYSSTLCYSQDRDSGEVFSEPCDFCVRR